jgi:hypothetical protein
MTMTMNASNLEIIAIDHLNHVIGGKAAPRPTPPSGGVGGFLDNVKVNVSADVNKLVDSIGGGAQRLIGCGFGANSRQEFGRCVLNGKLDGQK